MSETMVESQSQTWFLADLSSTTLQSGSCQRNPETQPQDITLHNISSVRRLKAISYFMHLCRWLGITEATDFVGSHPKHQSGSRIFCNTVGMLKSEPKFHLAEKSKKKSDTSKVIKVPMDLKYSQIPSQSSFSMVPPVAKPPCAVELPLSRLKHGAGARQLQDALCPHRYKWR